MNPPTQPPAISAQDETASPPEQEPLFAWFMRLQADQGAGPNARLRARTRLTMANWPGDIEVAAFMAARLADNAARHGKPFSDDRIILRLTVMKETRDLVIAADDAEPPSPTSPRSAMASRRPSPACGGSTATAGACRGT